MQQVLALAAEPRRAVGHDAAALRRADLAAQIRLARPAELALATFGGAGASARTQHGQGSAQRTTTRRRGRPA